MTCLYNRIAVVKLYPCQHGTRPRKYVGLEVDLQDQSLNIFSFLFFTFLDIQNITEISPLSRF